MVEEANQDRWRALPTTQIRVQLIAKLTRRPGPPPARSVGLDIVVEQRVQLRAKPRLRASTWANYRTYTAAYVVPVLGQIKLQALPPVQLNHLYAHLLERGRRKPTSSGRTTGLAPKTVRTST